MNKKLVLSLLLLSLSASLLAQKAKWLPLKRDGLHDPQSPAINILQQPSEALSLLPPDYTGNQVSWVDALQENYIEPRSTLFSDTQVNTLEMDIVMGNTGEMPMVMFPHTQHTEWLDCKNCHDVIFKEKAGSNPINMFAILNGEYCGRCHGAVAFPLTECNRCHSVPRNAFTGKPGVQPNGYIQSMKPN